MWLAGRRLDAYAGFEPIFTTSELESDELEIARLQRELNQEQEEEGPGRN